MTTARPVLPLSSRILLLGIGSLLLLAGLPAALMHLASQVIAISLAAGFLWASKKEFSRAQQESLSSKSLPSN